jgi:hypothetical protein
MRLGTPREATQLVATDASILYTLKRATQTSGIEKVGLVPIFLLVFTGRDYDN